MENRSLVDKVTEWAAEKKAESIEVFDVRGKTDYTDFVFICTASGELHLRAIANYILDQAKSEGHYILGKEGLDNSKWALIDFGEMIVHVFDQTTRSYYKLDEFLKKELEKIRKDNI